MAALLNLEGEQVREICGKASSKGVVVPANWNSPGQIVVSGDPEGVAEAVRLAQEAGSRRSVMLPVSGAFHSPLVQPAVETMRAELAKTAFRTPTCKFVANVSAKVVDDVDAIRAGLADQIVSCVLWSDSIRTMAAEGARTFIEVGSGKVLTGLLKRIDKELQGIAFGSPDALEAVRAA